MMIAREAKQFELQAPLAGSDPLTRARDIARVGLLLFSLLTNVFATFTVGLKAW